MAETIVQGKFSIKNTENSPTLVVFQILREAGYEVEIDFENATDIPDGALLTRKLIPISYPEALRECVSHAQRMESVMHLIGSQGVDEYEVRKFTYDRDYELSKRIRQTARLINLRDWELDIEHLRDNPEQSTAKELHMRELEFKIAWARYVTYRDQLGGVSPLSDEELKGLMKDRIQSDIPGVLNG